MNSQTEQEVLEPISSDNIEEKHPLRFCTIGYYFVREHKLHIPPSKKHPQGLTTIRHAHCAKNPKHQKNKHVLSYDEIQKISTEHFTEEELSRTPFLGVLNEFHGKDSEYDNLIRGWVQYWNDVLRPSEPLDPDLVKALIGSESSFKVNPKDNKVAHGLMQIIDKTLAYLNGKDKELSDYHLRITKKELFDPSANICAGVRWLFRKKQIATKKLGREATWEETVVEYKGNVKKPDFDGMNRFRDLYMQLKEQQV